MAKRKKEVPQKASAEWMNTFADLMNLLLSGLGAFVHPMRLTFMEYFKNAGYEGKGAAYNPLTTNKE